MKYSYNGQELFPTAEIYHDIYPYLSGVSMTDYYVSPEKCAYAWKTGTAIIKEQYGELFPMRPVSPPPLSYGHLISIGAPVKIPEDGEPNISAFAGSVDEAIDILNSKKGIKFEENEMFEHYLSMWEYLKEQFPNESIPFTGFSHQGPLTSAVLMRGQEFLCDLYDEPEKSKEFLNLLTDSIIDYIKLCRRINGQEEIQATGAMADDFSSLISPGMWSEFVIPFWNRYFEGICNGVSRFTHVENLTPHHLKYLKDAKLTHYQPSVSDMLTLENVKANLDPKITFDWLLYSYRVTDMTNEEIQEWVDNTVKAGVLKIRTQLGAFIYQQKKLDRINEFFNAFGKYSD